MCVGGGDALKMGIEFDPLINIGACGTPLHLAVRRISLCMCMYMIPVHDTF